MMKLEDIFLTINDILDTKPKRHLIGGVLLSTSLFFGGLAFTVMTIKERSRTINEE